MDGGYYAIKGFCFQYDKTIFNILNSSELDDIVEIEQKEDVSDSRTIYQIKYKESTKFSPSAIKKPVCQLIDIFKTDKRDITLYAYFKDKKKEINKLTIDQLNEIIGDCKIKSKQYIFDEILKNEFLDKFTLEFAEDYIKQFENIINKIRDIFNCDEDNALIIYPQIYKYIEGKVVNNNPDNIDRRTCTKRELIKCIRDNKEIIFFSTYSEFIGKEEYLRLIKKNYFIENNISPTERLFVIEVEPDISVQQLKDISVSLKNRFYKPYRNLIKSPAPYILFRGVDSVKLVQLKRELISEGINIRDGYSFYGSEFTVKDLTEKCTIHNKVSLKFINEETQLDVVIDNIERTKKMFHFHSQNSKAVNSKLDHVKIGIESTTDIIKIFR